MARVRSTDQATSLTLSLSSLSRPCALVGERNRLRLHRAALANSGHLRRRAVGQTPPQGSLYHSTEGIASSISCGHARPRPSRVRVRVPANLSSLRRSWWLGAEQWALCRHGVVWCGARAYPLLRCAPSMGSASPASPPWSYGHRRQVHLLSPLFFYY